jgi:hypothetical protein
MDERNHHIQVQNGRLDFYASQKHFGQPPDFGGYSAYVQIDDLTREDWHEGV